MSCLFCSLRTERVIDANALAVAIRDGFPVSPGHTLILPKRHIRSFFEATTTERMAMLALVDQAKATIDREFAPEGHLNVVGAGQELCQDTAELLAKRLLRKFKQVRAKMDRLEPCAIRLLNDLDQLRMQKWIADSAEGESQVFNFSQLAKELAGSGKRHIRAINIYAARRQK